MLKLIKFIPAVLMMACAVPAQASIINGDFETGDATGWDSIGAASVTDSSYMSGPLEGSFSGLVQSFDEDTQTTFASADDVSLFLGLTDTALDDAFAGASDGAAFAQTMTFSAGDVIELTFRFLTDELFEEAEFNDVAFYSLTSTSVVGDSTDVTFLADTFEPSLSDSASEYDLESDIFTTDITILADGEYRVGFGVLNINDDQVSSGLMIDIATSSVNPSVPEPGTIAIWSVLGVAGFGIARRRAKKAKAA